MSSKLQDIRQAVAAYTALQKDNTMTSLEFARRESDLAFDVIISVPDLLAIAEAAQAVDYGAFENYVECFAFDRGPAPEAYQDLDKLKALTDALAKLEGE